MKLESLPNDLLLEIFDYLDSIDLFRIFPHLNARFNQLIEYYSRNYHFNFQSITKNDMDLICQETFRKNLWKIYSLTLSDDDDTPYQTNEFFSYKFHFYRLVSLRSLSLHHIRCSSALFTILRYLSFLSHFNSLKIDQIDMDIDQIYDFSGPIWSLTTLTDLYISDLNFVCDRFIYDLVISVSLKRIHLLECSFLLKELKRLLECSPNVEELSIEVYQDAMNDDDDDDSLFVDDELRSILPLIRILNIKFTGYFSGLDYILKLMPNLQKLHIELINLRVDGYQWQDLICDHLSNLSIFHLKMSFYLDIDCYLEIEIDELIESYQRSYWTSERQLDFRCHTNTEYYDSEEKYFVLFYSLPYVFDAFKYIKPVYSKSTNDFEEIDCRSYDNVRILCLIPDEMKSNDEIDDSICFSNIRHLVIGYTFKHLEIICPKLDYLTILDIQYLDGQIQSRLQTLLNRASRLQTIIFNKNNWFLFFLASNSVRRLFIRDGIYYNIQQCEQLCTSSLFQQCQVLEINLRTPTSVIDLINKMPHLRTLIFQCQRDPWMTNSPESDIWFKRYLPSHCTIKREDSGSYRLAIS
ncbi:hypothetical protein I4U23_004257 [Adineta vaga]|nr:hypothetical protein I4U23_004257 [Adineta vaga]